MPLKKEVLTKCFFCRKEGKLIRCEECLGRTDVPMIAFKGGGWAASNGSLLTSGQAKSFDKTKAPSYKDLEKNGYLDYVKKNNEKAKA